MESLSHPNWWLALKCAEAVIPGISGLEHHEISDLATAEWTPLDTDDRSDEEIWRELRPQITKRLNGQLVVITFASFASGAGPFFVEAEDLDRLVAEHATLLGDVFFSGDVSIWAPPSRTLIAVHHDGGFAVVQV